MDEILEVITIALYAIIMIWQGFLLSKSRAGLKWPILVLSTLALFLHACLLHNWIDVEAGQNLTFFNIVSLVVWLSVLLIVTVSLRKSVESLLVIVCPIAILSIFLAIFFPSDYLIATSEHPMEIFHIIIAVFTFSVLCLAALQALLLWLQERLLRQHKTSGLLQVLPSLEAIEILLFQTIGVGFIMLSIVLGTGFVVFDNIFQPLLLQKTLLSLFAWCIFAVLLTGRYFYGWRGKIAINYTLFGVGTLVLSYFGSRIILSFVN